MNSATAWRSLGALELLAGNSSAAETALRKSLTLPEANLTEQSAARALLIQSLFHQSRVNEAAHEFDDLRKQLLTAPTDRQLLRLLSDTIALLKRTERTSD